MSYNMNNSNKEGSTKRKLSFSGEDSDSNCKPSKKFNKAISENNGISRTKKDGFPKLYFKNTSAYTQVIANPKSLPKTPKIFNLHKEKEKGSETSDNFLHNFLTVRTFNATVSDRFSNVMLSNNNNCNSKNKMANQKVEKEKTSKEKLEKSIISRKKKRKEMKKKRIEMKKKREEMKKKRKEKQKKPKKMNGFNKGQEVNGFDEENVLNGSNSVYLYEVVNKNALIFHLQHPSKFSFHGELKLTAILGEVEILGYTLNPYSCKTSVDIYSPMFYNSLTVETKFVTQNKNTEELKMCLKDLLREHDLNELLLKLKPSDSILYAEQVISNFGIVMNKYFEKQLFPKDLQDFSSTSETFKSLQSIFRFQLSSQIKHYKKNPEWDTIPLGQCTVICGGKGVGKSTLLKYYINKLVSSGEKVLCLDLDPGHPEFHFPGSISAVIIDEPLLGPNFTHIKDPVMMTCLGDTDVSQNPKKYLECVKYVIQSCQQNEKLLKLKWFVNTMGFCKGLGIDLMITTLKLLNPDKVIQIKCSQTANNYPFKLTPSCVNSRTGYGSMPLDHVSLYYDLSVIASVAESEKKQLQDGLKRRELRDIMSISYFSRMVSPPFYNFNAVQPYVISFSKLYLGIDFLIHPNDVLKAFNGNTVSLSHLEPENQDIVSVNSEEEKYFKVVVKPTLSPCLGLGFVRGIDCKEKRLYLITHVPVETLNNVNCLTLVRVSPPHSMFLRQDTVEGQAFYVTQGRFDVFLQVKRNFRVQKNLQNADKTSA